MTNTQIVRLRQDVEELTYFVKRLEKEGEKTRISLIQSKIKFVQDTIARLEDSSSQNTITHNQYIC